MKAFRAAPTALVLLIAASCTGGPRFGGDTRAEHFLPAGAAAYIKVDRPVLTLVAPAFLAKKDLKQADSFITGMDSALAGVSFDAAPAIPGHTNLRISGIAVGAFPASKAATGLRLGGWKYREKTWRAPGGGLFVAFADGGRVLFGNEPLDVKTPAAQRFDPIPSQMAMGDAAVALYLANPIAALSAAFISNEESGNVATIPDIPLKDAFFRADPPLDGRYACTLGFTFNSPRDAIVYSIVARLAFFSMATRAWPDGSDRILESVRWKTEGAMLLATGMTLEAKNIAALFLSLVPAAKP